MTGKASQPFDLPEDLLLESNKSVRALASLQVTNYLEISRPLFYAGSSTHDLQGQKSNFTSSMNSSIVPFLKGKLVLFYTRYRGNAHWMDEHMTRDGIMYSLNTNTHRCPFNCTFTHEKRLASRSNAIIFSIVDNFYFPEFPSFPKVRTPEQVWIAYASTVAANVDFDSNFDETDSIYNWTASYRLDSDIYWPYGYFYTLPNNPENSSGETNAAISTITPLKTKQKKLIASMITSKCTTKSFREGIISELQTYIEVDIYGACGSHKCPHTLEDRDPCLKHIGDQYKFYLAFENALCEDYITDEFFAAFEHGMVPVTYGLGDYTQVAPHHSYINMLDFPSLKHLAKYLVHLSTNGEEYRKLWELDRRRTSRKVCKSFRQWWNRKRSEDWGKDYFRKWFLNSKDQNAACKYFAE
ncbi:unnamed protein product [Allacma fusca]|uniref:Fucosyltransferase n=1 Tax=Allacma fusca TaxID=39272 RepID=A0A8J2PU25_9HEXA|nr:unnamed protein product [Allacma fusca]